MGKCNLQWQTCMVSQAGWGSHAPLSALRTLWWDGQSTTEEEWVFPVDKQLGLLPLPSVQSRQIIPHTLYTNLVGQIVFSTGKITNFLHWKLSLRRASHSPVTIKGKKEPSRKEPGRSPGYANTPSWSSSEKQRDLPSSCCKSVEESHPSAFSTVDALPFVLADAL